MVKGDREYLFDHPSAPSEYKAFPLASYPGTVARRKGHTLPRLALTAIPIGGVPTVYMPDKATMDQLASLTELGSDSSALATAMTGGANAADPAVYIIVAMHEGFHAFQQRQDIGQLQRRFDRARGSLDEETFQDRLREVEASPELVGLLRNEAQHLARALETEEPLARRREAQAFLTARDARHQTTSARSRGISPQAVAAFETQYEWMEGMARYVETQVSPAITKGGYKPSQLARAYGLASRQRSYVLGAGICLLLDRLGAEWKRPAIAGMVPLEELLRQALERK
jgi:hypothetical protein